MPDFRIYPATATLSTTGSANMIGSGSTTNPTIFSVNGNNGRLLEVTDDLSNSIFSANTIAGLPVIEAFANNCVVLGQFGGHQLRVTCTSIAGGSCSTASGNCSFVGGGRCNSATGGFHGTVSGGYCNTASGCRASTISGGFGNTASNSYSTISGGYRNSACGARSFIGGGSFNCTLTSVSAIAGGCNNRVCTGYGFVGGGGSNTASSYYAFVGGGAFNTAQGNRAIVVGGNSNVAAADYSFVGGGANNNLFGQYCYSSIIGGCSNSTYGCNTHILGANISATSNNYTYVNNLCQVGGGISDRRTKNTICDTGYRLCDIVKLRPVSYCWNHDPTNNKKYGFIAQEVQEAIPDIVDYNEIEKVGPDGKRTIMGEGEPVLQFDREAIYASYVNGFKELKAENDALKARIEAIEDVLKRNGLI